jgi:glycosyltransferase involved in cell wall biosynthesis
MPLLTVTLPVYNAMPYLPAAIESVLNQTFREFEFLIIDDGSSDGSSEYLRSLRDPRIRLVVRENRGLGATLNEAFDRSETEYVARMDADDICVLNRLEKQMEFLRGNDDTVMLGSGFAFFIGSRLVSAPQPPLGRPEIRQLLLQKRCGICHASTIVKRSAWASVGGYRVSGAGEDLDFCLRLCEAGQVSNLPEVLYHYRLHEKSVSSSRWGEISLGYAYAVACAQDREQGNAEQDLEAFRTRWAERSLWCRGTEWIDALGEQYYRRSIARSAVRRPIASGMYLLGAALCRPRVAVSRLLKRNTPVLTDICRAIAGATTARD